MRWMGDVDGRDEWMEWMDGMKDKEVRCGDKWKRRKRGFLKKETFIMSMHYKITAKL